MSVIYDRQLRFARPTNQKRKDTWCTPEWWEANERRFSAAMLDAHAELRWFHCRAVFLAKCQPTYGRDIGS